MPRTKKTAQPATVEGLTLAPAELQPKPLPVIDVLLVTIKQAAEALQVSERTVFNLLDNGSLESVTFGGARRIPIDSVRNLARTGANLPTLKERAARKRKP